MDDADRQLARKLSTIPELELPVGVFVEAASGGQVLVDFGDGPVPILSAGLFEPLPGESVRVLRTSAGTVLLGPSLPRSSIGQVTATGSPALTVDTSSGSVQLPYITSYSPTLNDVVLIDWASGGVVVGAVTAIPAGSYTPPPSSVTEFEVDFRAFDSGSYRSGSWWTSDVWVSSTNTGCFFYKGIADTIPDAAEILSVQIYLVEFYNEFPSSLAEFGLHNLASKVGAPSIDSAVDVAAGTGFRSLPASFGDQLKSGARKGVGASDDGYHKFRSVASNAQSGMLRIKWRV